MDINLNLIDNEPLAFQITNARNSYCSIDVATNTTIKNSFVNKAMDYNKKYQSREHHSY